MVRWLWLKGEKMKTNSSNNDQTPPDPAHKWSNDATISEYITYELSGFSDEDLIRELIARWKCRLERIEIAMRGFDDDRAQNKP
jgi:hypothetical protein